MVTLILAWRRQRQADLHEFKASLVYKSNSRFSRIVNQEKPCLKKTLVQIKGIISDSGK